MRATLLRHVEAASGTGCTGARSDRARGAGRSGPGVGRGGAGRCGAPGCGPPGGGDRAESGSRAAGPGRRQGMDPGRTTSRTRRRAQQRGRRRASAASAGTSTVVPDRAQAGSEITHVPACPWWRTCGPSVGPVRSPSERSSTAIAASQGIMAAHRSPLVSDPGPTFGTRQADRSGQRYGSIASTGQARSSGVTRSSRSGRPAPRRTRRTPHSARTTRAQQTHSGTPRNSPVHELPPRPPGADL
jgi:hypothetical protein